MKEIIILISLIIHWVYVPYAYVYVYTKNYSGGRLLFF